MPKGCLMDGLLRGPVVWLAKISALEFSPMFRISALLCAALLISAPAFAGGCSGSKNASASESTEQKKDVES